jgi:hypothetical protein
MTMHCHSHTLLIAATAGLLLCALPQTVHSEEQLVYWPLVTDGTEYRRISYPKEAGSILVLADTTVVIEAKPASVSYWPITREYLADFSKSPVPIEGSVEIVSGTGEVMVVEPTSYVLWHPDGVGLGPTELLHGEETAAFYDRYVTAAREAAEAAKTYQRIVAERQAALEAWLRIAAERPANLPAPPPEIRIEPPEPYRAFATEPKTAAVVTLPAGVYTIRLRDKDGTVLAGSERELVSFAPLARAVGYVLRPEDRWTQPIVSFAPDETIYTTGRSDIFFQPVPVVEFEARQFTRLFRPQSVEFVDSSLTLWTPEAGDTQVAADATLALWRGGGVVETLPRTPYRVVQLPGASRGYAIEQFKPEAGSRLEPDFQAMRVGRNSSMNGISLLESGEAVAGSARRMHTVHRRSDVLLFLPAFVPLAVGLAISAGRRRRH